MNNFLILHPTGLLYRFMHSIAISEPNSIKFGKHVPEKYVYECMSSHLLLWICRRKYRHFLSDDHIWKFHN